MLNISERIKKLRSSADYKKWRNSVIDKYNGKCVICGSTKNIEVDHIKPLALYPELALDYNNGRVLCKKCHKETLTYGSLSRYKGDGIHPILSGDLLIKIKSLPTTIRLAGKERGLRLVYIPEYAKWKVGYAFFNCIADDIESALGDLFKKINKATTYSLENDLSNFNNKEKIMSKQRSTILERRKLYEFIEKILRRKLTGEEKGIIGRTFSVAVIKYHEAVMNNLIKD